MSKAKRVLRKVTANRVTGAAGNDTKGQHSLEEEHQYDASHLDYDELRDERERQEAGVGEFEGVRDERRVAYEEELSSDSRAIEAYNEGKLDVMKHDTRAGRNRIKDAYFEKRKKQIVSYGRKLANQSENQADDAAVERFASEITADDDVGKYREKPGYKSVDDGLSKTFARMVPDLPSPDVDIPDYQPEP